MWFVFLLVMLGGLVVALIGWFGLIGRLPRQHVAGIRTPYTLSSEARWRAVHRIAGPFLIFGGAAAFAMGAALLPFSLAGSLPRGFEIAALMAVAAAVFASVLVAWRIGVAGARRELGEQ
jgi:uncharacterized membrane protein